MTRFFLPLAISLCLSTACSEGAEQTPLADPSDAGVAQSEGDAAAPEHNDASHEADLQGSEAAPEDGLSATDPEDASPSERVEDTLATSPEDVSAPIESADPDESGEWAFSVSTHTETLSSGDQSSEVLMVIYMPEGEGPFPLVIFTHGFQLAPADYVSYGEKLASWGYIALLPQLPGALFDGPNHVELKGYLSALIDWVDADAPQSEGVLLGKADPSSLGLAGHSMGGKISLLLATEDERPLAVFGVDPVDAAGGPFDTDPTEFPSVTPELMDQIDVPLALIGETTNGEGAGGFAPACAPAEDNFHQYYVHATSPAIEVEILGASHMSFLDDPDCGLACFACPAGTDDPAQTRALSQGYMVAFFNLFIRNEEGYRTFLVGDKMNEDIEQGLVLSETKNSF